MKAIAWKKICCPVDSSGESRAALEVAVDLCRRLGAELTLLHVGEPGQPAGSFDAAWRKDAEAEGVKASTDQVAAGSPSTAIAEYAARHGFDAIVMGTHARTGREHMLTGSVAETTVRLARCPVMVVHAP